MVNLGTLNQVLMDGMGLEIKDHCFIMLSDLYGNMSDYSTNLRIMRVNGGTYYFAAWTTLTVGVDIFTRVGFEGVTEGYLNSLVDAVMLESWSHADEELKLVITPFFQLYLKFMNKPISPDIANEITLLMDEYIPYSQQIPVYTKTEKKERKPKIGNVYLMKNERNGYIKIGYTKNEPKFRERTLQSQEPEITLMKSYKGCISDEQGIHFLLSEKRIRGEWFDLDEEDLLTIEKYFDVS